MSEANKLRLAAIRSGDLVSWLDGEGVRKSGTVEGFQTRHDGRGQFVQLAGGGQVELDRITERRRMWRGDIEVFSFVDDPERSSV